VLSSKIKKKIINFVHRHGKKVLHKRLIG